MYRTAIEAVKKTLNFAEVNYGQRGIEALCDNWFDNKFLLREILIRHPNWNSEALAIIMPFEEEMKPEWCDARYAAEDLYYRILKKVDGNFPAFYYLVTPESEGKVLSETSRLMFNLHGIAIPVGQKITRAIRNICKDHGVDIDKDPELRKIYNSIGENMATHSVKRYGILSVNPADFLMMSYGTDWASCHIINPDIVLDGDGYSGCYKAGVLSYAMDSCTAIFYTVDKMPENIHHLPVTPRATRQLFMIDTHNGCFMQSRLYPYKNNDGMRKTYRMFVEKIIATCMGFDDMWKCEAFHPDSAYSEGQHYRDYDYGEYNCKWVWPTHLEEKPDCELTIGHESVCLICGEEHDDDANVLYCHRHVEHVCPDCGQIVTAENGVEIDGVWYCNECVEECPVCGGRVRRCNMRYVSSEDICVCWYCYHNEYSECQVCGEIVRRDEMTFIYGYGMVCDEHISGNDENYRICSVSNCLCRVQDGDYDDNGEWYHARYLGDRFLWAGGKCVHRSSVKWNAEIGDWEIIDMATAVTA